MSARTRSLAALLLTVALLGAGCTAPPGWYTPLMKAAYEGNSEEVLRLIKDKANVNEPAPNITFRDPFPGQYVGTTPLMAAARGGQLGTARILLEHGANVNAIARFNYTEATALTIAAHGATPRRPYSIASAPDDVARSGYLELLIGLGGDGTPGPHLRLRPGERVDIEGPVGRFTFPDAPLGQRFLFIAGGTGISPLRARSWSHLSSLSLAASSAH